jgi:hypothetical protein
MTTQPQFFLKTAPLQDAPQSRYTNLYLRHHGSGINSVVLTPSPPKFIKAHQEDGKIHFTSASHEGRKWGLVLKTESEAGKRAGWEKVEIVENASGAELVFDKGVEVLVGKEVEGWKGWMVCEWATGHPQLFWVTDELKSELPEFCESVAIVREWL